MDIHPIARAALALGLISGALTAQAARPDPELDITTWGDHEVVARRLLVEFDPQVSAAAQHVRHELAGATLLRQLRPNLALIRAPSGVDLDGAAAGYLARSEVRAVEPDVLHRPTGTIPSDVKWHLQWGASKVGAPAAWDLARGDPDCIVAVIDSGVHGAHVDLDEHYAFGWDHYAQDADPSDGHGHGTHCAGVAAAETDNATGVAGMAFDCRFAAYRVGDASFPTSSLVAAIDDAVDDGCQVLSMSWGSAYDSSSIRNALQDARDAGCVLVAAAGNDGLDSEFYPAAHPFVIAVASSAPNDTRSTFSNFGDWVDVAAPGQSIYSTYNTGGYAYLSGTSMATPLVAGLATLMYAELGGTRSPANAELIRAALEDTCVPVGSWVIHGRVDAPAALQALGLDAAPQLADISPAQVDNLGGQTVTLTGSGLSGVDSAAVAGAPVDDVSVTGDASLEFVAPAAPALGPLPVVAVKGAATSNGVTLTYVEADPPRILAAASVTGGAAFSWTLGGGAHDAAYLLLSVSPVTVPFKGHDLLATFVVAWSGALDTRGLAVLPVSMPAGVGPITLYSQLVTADGGDLGVSAPVGTTLQP